MNNAELIKALRYCADYGSYKNGCAKCPINADGMVCGTHEDAVAKAADALEAADKRIVELNTKCADLQSQINEMENEIEELMPKDGVWITADNPPKKEGLYLVGLFVGWDNEYVVRLARYTKDLSEVFFSSKLSGDGWYRWDGDNDCDVICHPQYWMELPEPPNCGARMRGEQE